MGVCTVSTDQNITIFRQSQYTFDSLTLEENVKLWFFDKNPLISTCFPGGAGGDEWRDCGAGGGAGGAGGCTFRMGKPGSSGGDNSKGNVGSAGRIGGHLTITVNGDLNIKSGASLSADGEDGGKGSDGYTDGNKCIWDWGTTGGAGGGAGGSGGYIKIFANKVSGDGFITAKGGAGGAGGNGGAKQCNDGDGTGSGGGGGGMGGAGGTVEISAAEQLPSDHVLVDVGAKGIGGKGGCKAGDGNSPKNDAYPGEVNPTTLKENCFNRVDDDYDTYRDMEDSGCYNKKEEGWDSLPILAFSEPGLFQSESSYDWWNPLSYDGSDAVCGDDGYNNAVGVDYFMEDFDNNDNNWKYFYIYLSFEEANISGGYLTVPASLDGVSVAPYIENNPSASSDERGFKVDPAKDLSGVTLHLELQLDNKDYSTALNDDPFFTLGLSGKNSWSAIYTTCPTTEDDYGAYGLKISFTKEDLDKNNFLSCNITFIDPFWLVNKDYLLVSFNFQPHFESEIRVDSLHIYSTIENRDYDYIYMFKEGDLTPNKCAVGTNCHKNYREKVCGNSLGCWIVNSTYQTEFDRDYGSYVEIHDIETFADGTFECKENTVFEFDDDQGVYYEILTDKYGFFTNTGETYASLDQVPLKKTTCIRKSFSTPIYGDKGFVLEPAKGSYAYPSRFLCLQDKDPSAVPVDPLTPIIYNDIGGWRWWDSYSDTPFRIHKLNGDDYISSGEEWFYCDAHENDDRFAKRVPPYESFSIDTYSTDLCAWTPSDFFARKFVDVSSGTEQRLGNYVFRNDCSETTVTGTDIYRDEMNYLVTNGYQGKDLSWMQEVLELNSTSEFNYFKGCCYVGDSNEGVSTALGWGLFSKEGGDSLGVCMEDHSNFYCYSRGGTKIIPPPDAPPLQPIENEGVDLVDKFGPDSETYVQTIEESACDGRGRDHNVISDVCDLKTTTCVYNSLSDFTEAIPIRSSNPDEEKVCCLGGSCESLVDKTCSELGGFEYYYDPAGGNDLIDGCLGTLYKKSGEGSDDGIVFPQLDYGDNNRCCVGNIDWKQSSFEPVTDVVDAFICYPRSDNLSYFAECCSETTCFNKLLGDYNTASYKKMFDRGNVFTVGSSLFTVLSFDAQRVDDNGNLMDGVVDKIRHYRIPNRNEPSFDYNGVGNRLLFYAHEGSLNWSDFDYLSFDMMWSGKHRPQFLKMYDGSDNLIFSYNLSKYNPHNSMLPMIWVREMLPLNELGGKIPAYGILSYEIDAPSATMTDVFVDNFALRSTTDGDFKNYYCGGELRDWVEGLDVSGVSNPSEKLLGAYHLACDAQMSSKWTGSRCCGIATLNSSKILESEYYSDSLFGCWAGISISEGEIVSEAYFDPDFYPDILYFDGSFYSCDNVDSNHLQDMIGKTDVLGNLIISNPSDCPAGSTCTQITDVGPFGMVGDHYCDAGSDGDGVPRWRKTTFLPRAKILASKLYSLVEADDNFTLFCGKPEDGSVNIYNGIVPTSKFSPGSERVICSMTKDGSSGEVNGFVGVVLADGVDVKDYVDNQLRSFVPLDDVASHPVDCSILYTVASDGTETPYVDGTITSPEGAFLKCDDSGEDTSMVDLNVFYNPNLRLVYFSMEGKGETGFFQRMWEAIVNFFKNLFRSNAGEELAGDYASLPALPIDLYYNADFEDVYLARQGDLFVKGVMEQTDRNPDAYGLRVDYYNFSSDLSGMEKQLPEGVGATFSVNPNLHLQSLNVSIPSDAKAGFDWRYLVSNLRLKESS